MGPSAVMPRTRLTLAALLLLVLAVPAQGQYRSDVPSQSQIQQDSAESAGEARSALHEPVEVPPATDEAMRYYREGMVLWAIAVLVGFVVPASILFTGFSATLRRWARRIGGPWSLGTARQRGRGAAIELATAVFVAIYFAIAHLAVLPLAFYAGFVRQHAYGLSNQSVGQWLGEFLTAIGLETAFFVMIIPVGYSMLNAMRRRWWIAASVGAVITIIALRVVHPIWVAPLLDEYGPMQSRALEAEILDLAERSGIEGSRVFEVKKSADTKQVNASVTGFLGTKRIVLWDTIIDRLERDQLLFVMGHELGHYALGHAWKGLVLTGLALVATFYLAQLVLPKIVSRFRNRFGFDDLGDVASLPLFILTFAVLSFATTPVGNAISRHWEHEADRFGLEITQSNRAAATTFVELQLHNLVNPRPGVIYMLWRGSHPPLAERVGFANAYRPWESGAELRYGDRLRPEGG